MKYQKTKEILCKVPKAPKVYHEDFSVNPQYLLAQKGLPTPYRMMDFFSITSMENINVNFLTNLKNKYVQWNNNCQDHTVIVAFSPHAWNTLQKTKDQKVDSPIIPPQFHEYYKSNLELLIILKKKARSTISNQVHQNIKQFLEKSSLKVDITHGTSQANGESEDTVLGGKFNDNVEVPKDPISYALNALIGFDNPNHLGGSYLLAQKIDLNWSKLSPHVDRLETIVGRFDIKGNRDEDSSIISQNWCPLSHIKNSRVKDRNGNPILMARQSKPYFDMDPIPGIMSREKGVYFIGYLNKIENIMKIAESQFKSDQLIQFFNTVLGGVLYVPNLYELGAKLNLDDETCLADISTSHNINWSGDFAGIDEESRSPYLFYSRNQYLQKMSLAKGKDVQILNPPSSRTLRILSKTFALWQDTWYYDRRQMEMGHLQSYIGKPLKKEDELSKKEMKKCPMQKKYPVIPVVQVPADRKLQESQILQVYPGYKDVQFYDDIPLKIRQALGVYVELGHIFSSEWYGCRGPNSDGHFGAGTFHVEPEDVLVGGEANLTFGQGKHLLNYLVDEERRGLWMKGDNLSEHSGVGHVVPHLGDIIKYGLCGMIKNIEASKLKIRCQKSPTKSQLELLQLHDASIIALKGMQCYFKNYSKLAKKKSEELNPIQVVSKANLLRISEDLEHISTKRPTTLRQAAQIALSTFICLHITGEPVSIGRLDQVLSEFIPAEIKDVHNIKDLKKFQECQDIIDSFWIKVGEKVNLNKSFFEDHQKWGNLAMGGMSSPYPQGASFNQWGHQLTVGGYLRNSNSQEDIMGYNAITFLCLRASRTLPLNAPCLGLRVTKNMDEIYLEEAAKAMLSGGAHPILLNDDKVVDGLVSSGSYKIDQSKWNSTPYQKDSKEVVVPYENFNCEVKRWDARDYSSDGCFEFLLSGKCWFCLSGLPVLQPLELLLNQGKELTASGPRFIHGMRTHYVEYLLEDLQKGTFDDFVNKYFFLFRTKIALNFTGQLQNFGKLSTIWPSSLLNAFTDGLMERGKDFYSNGTQYNMFCPQFTGVSNLVNSLWNIKKYVFEEQTMTLQKLRQILLNNWGKTLTEPFVPNMLPEYQKKAFVQQCEFWRMKIENSEEKFGLNKQVTEFGMKIAKRISSTTMEVFSCPEPETIVLLKRLTSEFGDKIKFGIQIQPGCGTFENYQDGGIGCGPSFDGRLRGESLAEDLSLQPYYYDQEPLERSYKFSSILEKVKDPNFYSGAVLDFNIDEDFNEKNLVDGLKQFVSGTGPSIITVTTCDRKNIEELTRSNHKDLLRFRMGGWTEFGVAMFPDLLNHHIRRIRTYD